MGKIWLGMVGIALSSCAYAATVTYTLSLNEGLSGQCQANRFAIYATVSQGDNFGLRGFGMTMLTAAKGGANLTTFTNRSPNGTFDADVNDPDYDPNVPYLTKYAGFELDHLADRNNGVLAGIQDLYLGSDLVRVGGFGQVAGNMKDIHPAPSRNPADSIHPFRAVSYADYHAASNTDVLFGTTGGPLPAGSLRLATGVWSGDIAPSFDPFGQVRRAELWGDSQLQTVSFAQPSFATYNYCALIPEPGTALLMFAGSLGILRRMRVARV